MDVLRWINAVITQDQPGGASGSRIWPWVTIGLSVMVAVGYSVIAVSWYFQSKLARAESRASMRRLCWIVLCCAACGLAFYAAELGWVAWRMYDAVLLLLVCHTWWFALRVRGLSLVDERLAQVEELERSATKYREIAELLPHVVWTATAHGVIDYSNQRWVEYAGENCAWTEAVHPDERDTVSAWWNDAIAGREMVSREIRLRGQYAGYRTFVVRATPVVHGECVKWLGACADVEDQRRFAAERERQARQKTFFLNALSHDLRAPLHNVVLNAHLLKMTARGGITGTGDATAEIDESVDMIVENAVAAGDLVTKLLDFARAGEDRNVPERVQLAAMVQQVGRRFVPVAEQKGLTLRVSNDPGAEDAEMFVDRQKLERIVSNLLDNAIKFTDRGGIGLELVPLPAGGGSSDGRDVAAAAVRVFDSGVGIPASSIPFLFDEFYQVENHERDRNKGFGIGLAICRSLARQLGGDVRLVSTGPSGSCFEITLSGVRVGRRGRPDGTPRDRTHPAEAGLCRV